MPSDNPAMWLPVYPDDYVPPEQLLENIEKGRPPDFRPVVVPTGG